MTNIELLRTAKLGDKFRRGNGDVLEIVEMQGFWKNGFPAPPYAKVLVNGENKDWHDAFTWEIDTTHTSSGLTPIPAEPVVDLKPAREWEVLEAEYVRAGHMYVVSKATNNGFVGCRHYKNSTLFIYAGPSYAEAVAACEADMDGVQ